MRRLQTLTRMALHELWISFRLIPLVGLPVLGGMLVGAVPPELAGETAVGGAGFWYAVAAGAVISSATGLAALTMAQSGVGRAWMAGGRCRAIVIFWVPRFAILLIIGLRSDPRTGLRNRQI